MSEGAAILVRPAGESDLAEVLKLYAQPEIDKGDVLPLDEAQRLFRRFADYPDYTLFVAEQDGAVVGSFALLVRSACNISAPRPALSRMLSSLRTCRATASGSQ